MTIDEIFSQLSAHMVEGLMTHSQLSDYFGFLGLEGYQMCHRYHYFEENSNYRKLSMYYLQHYDRLIKEQSVPRPSLIPDSWYQYTRHDVNIPTRKSAIQIGFEKWVNWEKSTKKLYESLYQELVQLGEISAAKELAKYIQDVDYELAKAYQKHLELAAMDYDITQVVAEQEKKKKEYKKKMKEIEL